MSVIARAEVTVASITDVASTTRYYRLQSSTLNPPAKPTTSPPSGWTTTEPTYIEGSTNSLYTCDLTTFSDGTWVYSAVSLSSSYEYTKAVYNKAKAAADAAAAANAAATAPTYKIVANCSSVSQDPSGLCTPSSLSCRSYKTVASSNGTTSDSYYAGRLVIDASADGSAWTRVYTATSNSSLVTKALSSIVSAVEGCAYIRISLYQAGGTTTQLAQAVLSVVQATGNYMQHDSSGLYVCETQGDPNAGGALRLASDIIELIKDGAAKMSIGESEISLGIDDVQALIKLCGGKAKIRYESGTGYTIYESAGPVAMLANSGSCMIGCGSTAAAANDYGIGMIDDKAVIKGNPVEVNGYDMTTALRRSVMSLSDGVTFGYSGGLAVLNVWKQVDLDRSWLSVPIGTIPEGYRPSRELYQRTLCANYGDVSTCLRVEPNGEVNIANMGGAYPGLQYHGASIPWLY